MLQVFDKDQNYDCNGATEEKAGLGKCHTVNTGLLIQYFEGFLFITLCEEFSIKPDNISRNIIQEWKIQVFIPFQFCVLQNCHEIMYEKIIFGTGHKDFILEFI